MTVDEVIKALDKVKEQYYHLKSVDKGTKGDYFRVGNVAIKIAEITELK